MPNYRWWLVFSSLIAVMLRPAAAAVNVDVTRVIFNAGQRSASVALHNDNPFPTLVQMWSDSGEIDAIPAATPGPLVVLPPLLVLQPGQLRAVQLRHPGAQRPGREALYWLNIYQIPAQHAQRMAVSRVVLPLRLRLKVMVRPEGLGAPQYVDGQRLMFHLQRQGAVKNLRVTNPTPWHLTLTAVTTGGLSGAATLLQPQATADVEVKGVGAAGEFIDYQLINDLGNVWHFRQKITH